jgi:phage/plasmid-like protein (TIGR03299 family)
MAHMIDMSNNQANIAYVGDTPWHGLGQKLEPGADLITWRKQAGLDFVVETTPVIYNTSVGQREVDDRRVLFRNDTMAPLGVVSSDYNVVQPEDVLGFFSKLVDVGGFQLETAGSLRGGKRVWALAQVGPEAPILGHDNVRPYLLLGTSFDGSMATIARLTAIRVVCNNTITIAVNQVSQDEEEGRTAVTDTVRVVHTSRFDAEEVRRSLGIYMNSWEHWLISTKLMAEKALSGRVADELLVTLLAANEERAEQVRRSKAYGNIMELFEGRAIGSDLTQGRTQWQMLNSITQYIDHERGSSNDTRMSNAWFGSGEKMKRRAYELLAAAA